MENKKQNIELADIFRTHANHFLKSHMLSPEQRKAFHAIIQCRTSALGGHVDQCDHCGHIRPSYNSCRNRHCPKCQSMKKVQWVDKLSANLPPVKQFHVVFTIPRCLYKLFYLNQEKAYSLFFKAAGKTLLQCAASPKYLGIQAGAVAILHTWGQTLVYHPHIHMIVPAGGLSEDLMEWVPAGNKFFLPVKVLSAVFRGILCRQLKQGIDDGILRLPEEIPDFDVIKKQCYKKKWVVYCHKPFSGKNSLIQYLGNYIHRVAISNHRIIEHKNGKVSFWYKNYKSAGMSRCLSLNVDEFIRRFMKHVLPAGFYKIRYFGFMAICNIKTKLALCFEIIGKTAFLPALTGLNSIDLWRTLTNIDPLYCPRCKTGKMRLRVALSANNLKPG
ncbi:MAG TPA: IS91 family transposase [Desulfobacteraceae bacterium]|nr:IS91 family transposase [Desulfobacteraceae bacterium]